MLFERRRHHISKSTDGFYRLQKEGSSQTLCGFGDQSGFVTLTGQDGDKWKGTSMFNGEDSHSFRFQDENGNVLTGVSIGSSIVLRDTKGRTWKGVID